MVYSTLRSRCLRRLKDDFGIFVNLTEGKLLWGFFFLRKFFLKNLARTAKYSTFERLNGLIENYICCEKKFYLRKQILVSNLVL